MSSSKVLLGVIAGASIGAMAGILFAPDKGSSTRRKIVDHTNDLRSMLNHWTTDLIEIMKGTDSGNFATGFDTEDDDERSSEMSLTTMG